MDNNKNETDNIELRSEKVRHIIGQVSPTLVCPVTSHNDKLLIVDGNHYFTAKAFIHRYGSNAQPELKVSARIIVSDKTVWQQVFRK